MKEENPQGTFGLILAIAVVAFAGAMLALWWNT